MPPIELLVRFSVIVVAIGNATAWPAAIVAGDVLERQDDRQQEDAPTMPESQIADRTPRGAWRLASIVSSPNVPAVSKP